MTVGCSSIVEKRAKCYFDEFGSIGRELGRSNDCAVWDAVDK